MTQEQIEKLIKVGQRKKFNAVQLSQYLTQPPYNLCAADASLVYFEARKREVAVLVTASISPAMKLEANPVVSAKRDIRAGKKLLKPGKFPANVGSEIRTPTDSEDALALAAHAAGYTPSNLNRSSVKSCALAASTRIRAGKFKRVSPSFVKQVEAELENVIRNIGGSEETDDIPGEWDFLNRKRVLARVSEQLNRAVRKIILRKVRSYPSMGQTLK